MQQLSDSSKVTANRSQEGLLSRQSVLQTIRLGCLIHVFEPPLCLLLLAEFGPCIRLKGFHVYVHKYTKESMVVDYLLI